MGNHHDTILTEQYRVNILKAIYAMNSSFDESELNVDMKLESIPDWDSLTRINFIIALEESFGLPSESLDFIGSETVMDVFREIKKILES